MAKTVLNLYKENFKFSAAHFMIFDSMHAERLHGHNYKVQVRIGVPSYPETQSAGYSVDFNIFKKTIRDAVDQLDEMVLIPKEQPEMKIEHKAPSLHIHFRDRYYVFPANEVRLLPINNTSVEALSYYLADSFKKQWDQLTRIDFVEVTVEETSGQSASTQV